MSKIKRFIKLTTRQKVMVWEALFYAGKYRYLLLHRPFKTFSDQLGEKEKEQRPQNYTDSERKLIYEIAEVVDIVCNHTPWKSECLVRAFAAQRMLYHRGIPASVYMGVATEEQGQMIAHAWTKCGDEFVTGWGGHERFAVTGIFNTII